MRTTIRFLVPLLALLALLAGGGGVASAHTVRPATTCFQDSCNGQAVAVMSNCNNDALNGSVNVIDGYGHTVGKLYFYSSGATNGCMANFATFTLYANESLKSFDLYTKQEPGTWSDCCDNDSSSGVNVFGQEGPFSANVGFYGVLFGYEGTQEDCGRSVIVITSNNNTQQTYGTNWYCNN